ncbi:hypothetical protein [Paenibacillus durus]|uniref:Uncharacterized protein n=1 Tax=Paenibacillus durus ATCC 35681 TaxID=1333534 RepID=A0A0F7F9B8_PAEDU|nr:hypothetical protein [Paenibacillus durus]AKG34404.1 hypothetical protein VK70_07300 [Paenibacillus durus ATCC 35681]
MTILQDKYELVVEQEAQLLTSLRTTTAYENAIFQITHKQAAEIDLPTAEKIIDKIHEYAEELRLDLLYVRLEKSHVAGMLKLTAL